MELKHWTKLPSPGSFIVLRQATSVRSGEVPEPEGGEVGVGLNLVPVSTTDACSNLWGSQSKGVEFGYVSPLYPYWVVSRAVVACLASYFGHMNLEDGSLSPPFGFHIHFILPRSEITPWIN